MPISGPNLTERARAATAAAVILPTATSAAADATPAPPPPVQTALDEALKREHDRRRAGLVPLPPEAPRVAVLPSERPVLPSGLGDASGDRTILPDAVERGKDRTPNKTPKLPVVVDLVSGGVVETIVGAVVSLSNTKGVNPPPNALDKAKILRDLGRARPGTIISTAKDVARTPIAQRVLIYTAAGKLAGAILDANAANAGEANDLARREFADRLGAEAAAGQVTALTPAEARAIRNSVGDLIAAEAFIGAFNGEATANAKTLLGQDAVTLARLIQFPGLGMIRDAENPKFGLVVSFPQEFSDP